MDKFVVLINKNSGTVLRLGEDRVKALLTERLGDRMVSLELLETKDIISTLGRLAVEKPNGVLVGGGDGTAVCAAEILGPARVPFAVLPLGTMNLLAQDLGSAATFEQTIERFDQLINDEIDIGTVNGKIFLCSAVVGFVPESAVVREELREQATFETVTKFADMIRRGMGGEIRHKLVLRAKEDAQPNELETTSLIVSNNAYVKSPASGNERFMRETLSEGKLGVYSVAPSGILDGLKLAFDLWSGGWQEHENITSFETAGLVVETAEPDVLVSLDGEPVEMTSPLKFGLRPKSLPVLRMKLSELAA